MKIGIIKEKIKSGEKYNLILMDTFKHIYTYDVDINTFENTSVGEKIIAEEDVNILHYLGDNRMLRMY